MMLLMSVPFGSTYAENGSSIIDSTLNLMGNTGDCEGTEGWTGSNVSFSLDNTQKVFGSNSMKLTAQSGESYFIRDISNIIQKSDKYYLVSAYLKNGNIDSSFSIRIVDNYSSTNYNLCESTKQLSTGFKRVGIKLNADAINSNSTKRELWVHIVQSQVNSRYGFVDGIMINEITEDDFQDLSTEDLLKKYPNTGGTKYPTYPIKLGISSSYAVMEDGTVKAWGKNNTYQLGLGDTSDRIVPEKITSLAEVRSVWPGSDFSFALLNDGTVKAWGLNTDGQLGLGNTTNKTIPENVTSLYGVKQIAAGKKHAVALMDDGSVKVWGGNSEGQLGLGDNYNRLNPVTVPGLAGVIQVAAGEFFSLALMNDGTVKAWGQNNFGQLGLGDTENRNIPTTVPGLLDVTAISVGSNHLAVLLGNGTMKCWGLNDKGQLGLGDKNNRTVPTTLQSLNNVRKVALGSNFALALLNNGSVKAWGENVNGQLGLGDIAERTNPQSVPGLGDVKILEAGGTHAAALLNDGTVKVWGSNSNGQLGLGGGDINVVSPTSLSLDGIKTNSSPVLGVQYPSPKMVSSVRQNVLGPDGDCETIDGWRTNTANSAAVAVDDVNKVNGAKSIKGTLSITGSGYGFKDVKAKMDNTKYYFLSGFIKNGNATSVSLYYNFGSEVATPANTSTSYIRRGLKIQPSNMGAAAEYAVGLKINGTAVGQYGFIDNIMLIEITKDEYDSLTEDQLLNKYTLKNLLSSDGDCESANGWTAKLGTASADTNKTIGSNALKFVSNAGVNGGIERTTVVLDTSKYYFFSGYGKSASGGNLNMMIGNAFGAATGGGSTGTFAASEYVRKGFKFKPTITQGYLSLYAYGITGQQHTAYFDGLMLKEITQNEYNSLTVDQLLNKYSFENGKWEYDSNTATTTIVKSKNGESYAGISVSDPDNDTLTCKVYLDSDTEPKDTKVITDTVSSKGVMLNMGVVAEGTHLIRFEVSDGKDTTLYTTTATFLKQIKSITQSSNNTYALMEDGTVKAWGANYVGQLGLGDDEERLTPTTIPGLSNVKEIVVNGYSVLALLNDGTVKAWGRNNSGELGLGFIGDIYSPTTIEGLVNVRELVFKSSTGFAILNDSSVMAWGTNTTGQLGLGNTDKCMVPKKVDSLSNVDKIYTSGDTSYALCKGTLYSWGNNSVGQLGRSTYSAAEYAPGKVSDNVKQLLINWNGSLFMITNDGNVYAWGQNSSKYLGLGSSYTDSYYRYPVQIPNIANAKELFGNIYSTFVLLENGEVWAWGYNSNGQLGLGDKIGKLVPTKVDSYIGAKKIVVNDYCSFAIFQDGTVKGAGNNYYGNLGLGQTSEVLQPQLIPLPTNILDINYCANTAFAHFSNGSIKGWGNNQSGKLGLGDKTNRNSPIDIIMETSIPNIIVTYPNNNQVINGNNTILTPALTITDRDNEPLTIKAYFDSSNMPFDTQVISNTANAKEVKLNFLKLSTLTEGTHTIKFEVDDGIGTTVSNINFIYDKVPANGLLNLASTTDAITANALAVDTQGLDKQPYRFSLTGTNSEWLEANEVPRFVPISATTYGVGNNFKIIKVDNGYIGAVSLNSKIDFYRTNDNGVNWSYIGFIYCQGYDFSIASKGNMVYCLYKDKQYITNTWWSYIKFIKFDSQSISSPSEITGSLNIDSKNSEHGNGLSMVLDNTGNVHIAWTDADGSIKYNNSADGVNWTVVTRASQESTYCSEPVILINKNNQPYIIYTYYYNYNTDKTYMIRSAFYNGTKWINSIPAVGKEYEQKSPSAYIDKNGTIHVVWCAKDKTDNAQYNVFYTRSNDGSTWIEPTKLTSGNTDSCIKPTIYADVLNRVYVAWTRNGQMEKKTFEGSWGPIEKPAGTALNDNPSFIANTKDLAQPVMVCRDGKTSKAVFVEFRTGGTSYTFNSLQPGTKYTVQFESKDLSGNIAVSSKDIYTKAAVPAASIGTKTSTTANVTITDTNGPDTKYKVKVNDKFVQPDGTLSVKAASLPGTNKTIKVKGLAPNTTYQVYVKAVNGENFESKYSTGVSLATANTVPGVPVNIKASATNTALKITWDELEGAQSYDVEIDGQVTTNAATGTSYVKSGLSAGVSHNVRVRAVNSVGAGTWSGIVTSQSATAKVTQMPVNFPTGKIFNLVLSAGNMKEVEIYTFKISYDPAKVEVLDLCADTIARELSTGKIEDAGINVIEFNPQAGTVKYTVTKQVNGGTAWTGAVNTVKFRTKTSDPSTITYTLE
ncbi:MAG: fibronectin type III domain-containing protein [Clostridia bacterium]|nr:fibronectin type III domain-containing protein [Clostridia bacterium]